MLENAKGIQFCLGCGQPSCSLSSCGHLIIIEIDGRRIPLQSTLPTTNMEFVRSTLKLLAETHGRTLGIDFRIDDRNHMFRLN